MTFSKIAALAAALVMAACTPATEAPAAAQAPNAASAKAATASDESADDPKRSGYLRLLSPGAEPRAKLRYHFVAGHHETMVMGMGMNLRMALGDRAPNAMDVPEISTTMAIDIESVSLSGDATVTFRTENIAVPPSPELPAEANEKLQQAMNGLVGLKGHAVISARGLSKDAAFEAPANVDPKVVELLERLRQQSEEMAAPFPEEAVGVGATWERVTPIKTRALTGKQTATYTLKGRNGVGFELGLNLAQTAPPQPLGGMSLPSDMTASIERYESTGYGLLFVRVDDLVASSELRSTSSMQAKLVSSKETMPMKIDISMDVHVAHGAPDKATKH